MKFVILILALLLLAGCSSDGPSTQMDISKKSISLSDQQLSEFITITVTRKDDGTEPAFFTVIFPKTSEYVYPTDVDGNVITELHTKELRGKNAQDILQFKVYGTKLDFKEATFQLPVELRWNQTALDTKQLRITIE
jgi:hypothetical protein